MTSISVIRELALNPIEISNQFYLLKRNGYLYSSYIPVDDPTICCLAKPGLPAKSQSSGKSGPYCSSNTNLSELATMGKVGKTYSLILEDGTTVIVKITNGISPNISVADRTIDVNHCEVGCLLPLPTKDLIYLATDEFTNETLIAYGIDTLYTAYGFPTGNTYIKHIDAGLCSNGSDTLSGINIMEYANYGDLSNITKNKELDIYREEYSFRDTRNNNFTIIGLKTEYILNIIKQVLSTIYFLQSTGNFIHGDLKVANVLLSSQSNNSNYKGLNLNAPFTIKIADFGKSAITLQFKGTEPFRLYNRDRLAEAYLEFIPFKPKTGVTFGQKYYILDSFLNVQVYAQSRHLGIPFYSSYDIYTFIVSMFMVPEFYYKLISDKVLIETVWNPLWFPDEASKVLSRISNYVKDGKTPSFDNTISILKGIRLKCELISILMEKLM